MGYIIGLVAVCSFLLFWYGFDITVRFISTPERVKRLQTTIEELKGNQKWMVEELDEVKKERDEAQRRWTQVKFADKQATEQQEAFEKLAKEVVMRRPSVLRESETLSQEEITTMCHYFGYSTNGMF